MMERKEETILAALELASENGLKSVSMTQIAEKVRIKAPSLYNHFRSKDGIVKAMYSCLREKAQLNRSSELADPENFAEKNLEQIFLESLSAYLGMISDRNMMRFFRVLYSERSINPLAAEIMLEETEYMIRSTRNLFYALAVHCGTFQRLCRGWLQCGTGNIPVHGLPGKVRWLSSRKRADAGH